MRQMKTASITKMLFEKLDFEEKQRSLRGKKIVIWGLQKAGYIAAQYLSENKIDVIGIADNNKKRTGDVPGYILRTCRKLKEIRVFSPEEFIVPYNNDIIILVFSKYYNEILNQASEYGYSPEQCISVYDSDKILDISDLEELTPVSLDEKKKTELEILCFLRSICTEYGLRYYLAGGTLLGSIRHKGFIPWDDDIDIYMPWKDYKRLIELFSSGRVHNERYSLLYHGLCSDYSWIYCMIQDNNTVERILRFPQICELGISIDIFPLSGFPEDEIEQEQLKKRIELFLDKWALCRTYWDIDKNCSFSFAEKEIEAIMGRYDLDLSPGGGFFLNGHYSREICSSSVYSSAVMTEFEGEKFSAPVGFNEYLTNMYGDYMTLPPEKDRVVPHTCRTFRRV